MCLLKKVFVNVLILICLCMYLVIYSVYIGNVCSIWFKVVMFGFKNWLFRCLWWIIYIEMGRLSSEEIVFMKYI